MDYSRFDHIDTDSDEDVESNASSSSRPKLVPTQAALPSSSKANKGRIQFKHEGNLIYEWEQSLEEVNIYIQPPNNIPRNNILIGEDTSPYLLFPSPFFFEVINYGTNRYFALSSQGGHQGSLTILPR